MLPLLAQNLHDFPAHDLVKSSRWIRISGRLTLVALVLSTIGLFFVPWQQTAAGTGQVFAKNPQQRSQVFKSPVQGIVKWVRPDLREGSSVEQGEVLIELEPTAAGEAQLLDSQIEAARLKLATEEQGLSFAMEQVSLQRSGGAMLSESLDRERASALAKWEQSQRELEALESDLVNYSNKRAIAEKVYQKGIISQEELVGKQQDEKTQQRKVEKAKKAVEEAHANYLAKLKALESEQQDIEIKNREAENKKLNYEVKLQSLKQDLANLEVKRQELLRLKIIAPRSGFIQQWFGREGSDAIKEGEPLFVIVPHATEMAVELLVSGNDMPLVQVGAPVRLQFEGWPAVQFVGWPSVAVGTFGGTVNRLFPTDDGNGNFRVLVVPDNHLSHDQGWPEAKFLRQGVRVNGWILLNEVPLGYEIWRRINGFPPSLPDKDSIDKKSKSILPKL